MAGDWLKIEANTPEKPEVFEIAMQLGIDPLIAFARCYLVWRWFDQHTENGNAPSVTPAYVDHIAGVTGFADAMKKVGWLLGGLDGLAGVSLPNFDRHNGKTAKARGLTAKRAATHRQRNNNADSVTNALPREEKRRSKPLTPSGAFERFWAAYPKRKARGRAEKAFATLSPDEQLMAVILAALERAKTREEWRKERGKYIPHPATWLNDKGWTDEDSSLAPVEKRVAI